MVPGECFVAWLGRLDAAVEDADLPVAELAQGGLVADVPGADLPLALNGMTHLSDPFGVQRAKCRRHARRVVSAD